MIRSYHNCCIEKASLQCVFSYGYICFVYMRRLCHIQCSQCGNSSLAIVCPNTNFKAKFILPVRWANPSEITLNWVMWGLSILVLSNKWKSFVTIEPLLLFPSVISPMVYMDTSLLLTNLCPRIWCLCEKSFVYIHHGVFTTMCLREGSSFAIYSFIVCFYESVFVILCSTRN